MLCLLCAVHTGLVYMDMDNLKVSLIAETIQLLLLCPHHDGCFLGVPNIERDKSVPVLQLAEMPLSSFTILQLQQI